NLVPGRCDVPPSNGAPRNTTSYPSSASSSTRGTPRNVTSGPYIPRTMTSSGPTSPAMTAPFGKPRPGSRTIQGREPGPFGASVNLSRSARRLGHLRRLTREKPVQPARQPPVGLPEQLHHGRDQHQPHHGRVDQDGRGQPEADLLDRDVRGENEGQEDHHHDRRCGRDHPRGRGQPAPDGQRVVA